MEWIAILILFVWNASQASEISSLKRRMKRTMVLPAK